ncbi:uncharacterized protein LOC119172021 isoform X2 [Rhipicephalus microplus]|uniref:uncharacterized protein LOC119172021 isoform X2 n=1 Tax=Rhipicephalus microplus TaxID=6941 RepID=UPI003F6AF6E2
MELVREFGDPHVLTLAEDHIVLKLELPWPRDVEFPQGISLADDDGLLLVGNRESFVSARQSTLTRVARICKALFCGCASFDSWDRYASAATNLLRDAEEICIVHNRDKVHKLVRMFPNVKVLALLHDLCEHYVELDEPCRDLVAPLVEGSQLRKLVCSASNLYDGYLVMSHETTLALLRTCPDGEEVYSLDTRNKLGGGQDDEPHRLTMGYAMLHGATQLTYLVGTVESNEYHPSPTLLLEASVN